MQTHTFKLDFHLFWSAVIRIEMLHAGQTSVCAGAMFISDGLNIHRPGYMSCPHKPYIPFNVIFEHGEFTGKRPYIAKWNWTWLWNRAYKPQMSLHYSLISFQPFNKNFIHGGWFNNLWKGSRHIDKDGLWGVKFYGSQLNGSTNIIEMFFFFKTKGFSTWVGIIGRLYVPFCMM